MNMIDQLLVLLMVWFILAGLFHFIWTLVNCITFPDAMGFLKVLSIAFIGSFPATVFILAGVKGLWILFR